MTERSVQLFPAPQSLVVESGFVPINDADWMILPATASFALLQRVQDAAGRIGTVANRSIRVGKAAPHAGSILLSMTLDPSLEGQQYSLKVCAPHPVLRAGDEAGLFYGLIAFVQVLEQCGMQPPALAIDDSPDFPVRGVMLDVSRCKVPTMDSLRNLIDQLALLRLNQLQLYVEHTFAFSGHETVWHDASPLAHEEILELDQYGRDHFVELVPNLNSFGHVERWLRHPAYRHLAECPDGFSYPWGGKSPWGSTLAPTTESLRFVESLYDEYLPHFSSRMFNVGCDETWELGKGRSQPDAEKRGTTAVYLDFLKQIHGACVKRGRQMQFWGDIILHQPELIEQLPADCIALNWGYGADHPFDEQAQAFAQAGIAFYVCPGTSAWNSIACRTDNCLANLENAARNGIKHGAIGYLITDWGDGGHHQPLPASFLGYLAGAGLSWCLKNNQHHDWAAEMSRFFFADATGVSGNVLMELGRVMHNMPRYQHGNAAIYNQLLFNPLTPEGLDSQKYSLDELQQAESCILSLERRLLEQARITCPDREIVWNEFAYTIAMMRHAIHRGRYVLGDEVSKASLHQELAGLVRLHQQQWLARNRPGGLHESSERLRQAGHDYIN